MAKGNAITIAHKVSPSPEDSLQLYGVFTFRMKNRIIKIAEKIHLAV